MKPLYLDWPAPARRRLFPTPESAIFALALFLGMATSVRAELLDTFEDLSGWAAVASDGAKVEIARDAGREGTAMRIDFEFTGGGGHVLVKKDFALPLPPNYAFAFDVRGTGPASDFEFKLLDPSRENVWWRRHEKYALPYEWESLTIRKTRIQFAWGPRGSEPLEQVGSIEFGISANGRGGKGSVWIDGLRFEPRPVSAHENGVDGVRASTSLPGFEAERVFDHDSGTSWRSGAATGDQWLLFDFGRARELGGLVVAWDGQDYATSYQVQASDDGTHWSTSYASTRGNGGRDYIYMPDAEPRFVRLHLERSSRGEGYGIAEIDIKPFAFSASPTQFHEAMAREAPDVAFPKYLHGRQTYWTLVGAAGDTKEALLNEEGMLEVEHGAFSIEPFLHAGGQLLGWSSARVRQTLLEGYLPIPSVSWETDGVALTITAVADGKPGASRLMARYRVENRRDELQHVTLFLALRPLQVVPPWQSLNMQGGAAPIHEIAFSGSQVRVNDKLVHSLTPPDRFGATALEDGAITDFLQSDSLPPEVEVSDPLGFASGALAYGLDLAPGAAEEIDLLIPFYAGEPPAENVDFSTSLEATRQRWKTALDRVDIQLPPAAAKLVRSLKSNLAYILINRDDDSIQPGSRSYSRSWIRDGALTSTALLQMGFPHEVHAFLRWFADHQFKDGKIPCCIDRRGADPIAEHDSHGQFIYAVMEYYRYTGDIGFVSEMWPRVTLTMKYMAGLRRQRMTDDYRAPENRAFFGLLPESISHEGYASHPVHSYWDDFFALRGLKDAADLAVVVGDEELADAYARESEAFRGDLHASMLNTMSRHQIDYIPASVELGDFDPNSTAIGVAPGGELHGVMEPALTRTFDRYYTNFRGRRDGEVEWASYTPYELRNVETLVRLGQRERAIEVLESLTMDQRPSAWNQWAEIVWRDPTLPRFIGDMPHTWVGSSFISSVRSLLVYEREYDDALVLAAGVPWAWVQSGPGVGVKRLPTYWGVLHYTLRSEEPDSLTFRVSGDLTMPPGRIVLEPPTPGPIREARVNGRVVEAPPGGPIVLSELPAEVVLQF